ncbi:glycerophosphodiester phosphodiesterase GDPDL7-like [Andrographis paniculata]|uniref:glycerophosphodiester phosphodiesterase GDPDL7-like n=1 Tax=Andrographis paniculata TaxID=175694 RepID=UPI0021E9AC93|nr:glycerophosphodiester phosphodiesterase GDPDL7-like [Andrographis paniculata]
MIEYILFSILLLHFIHAATVAAAAGQLPPPPKKWMTLTGNPPEVVAKGGYSGFFPDSSRSAYQFAIDSGIPGTVLYCNLHFTKDNDGFCIADINLGNATNIEELDPRGRKTYDVYGQIIDGWFGLDYPAQFIFDNVTLRQNIFTRMAVFDGEPITGPFDIKEDVNKQPTRLWLNVEIDMFYNQHNVVPERYLLEQLNGLPEFISSPEIGFLKAIRPKLGNAQTKIIFVFLDEMRIEPTTKTPYGTILKDLATIKLFASGIVVPKEYIWPISKDRVLMPSTNVVQEAHRLGLTVYASGFANDNLLSYNYSYDPAREYLQFVDNPLFSVDGVLSAFPSTASEAIGCLNPDKNAPREIEALIISHNGASGDYPGSTDLAYQKAVDDGADVIDCAVQMSKDGTPFCSDRPDLMKTSTAAILYMDLMTNYPEIQAADGVFSFDLAWSEIQALKPQLENAFDGELARNPANKNAGKLVTLAEFLEIAKTRVVSGVLIDIESAPFLAKRGLDVVGAVETALRNAALGNQRVLIESDDTSVLSRFKDKPNYQRVLYINATMGGVPEQVASEVKKHADAVFVHRDAIIIASDNFAYNFTNTVEALHAAHISVYVGILKNEFQNLIFDYLSDPNIELATLHSLHVDGVVTDFPATASMFSRSSCTKNGSAFVTKPVSPGLLYAAAPVAAPPLLSTEEVVDPPLPAVAANTTPPLGGPGASTAAAPPRPKQNSSTTLRINPAGFLLAYLLAIVTLFT